MRALRLAVKSAAWRPSGHYESHRDDWGPVRQKILDRDRYTCVYCGFSAPKYQEVHHLDGDHENNLPENLVTTCPLCHATQHVGLAGSNRRGILVWLPELPQQILNYMVLWLELGPYGNADIAHWVSAPRETLKELLQHRVHLCEKRLGSADPTELGNSLLNLSEEQYERDAMPQLEAVRMLPLLDGYSEEQRRVWREQLAALVPDVASITGYLQAGEKRKK